MSLRDDFTVPNVLSALRIVASPIMLGFALAGEKTCFFFVFVAALVSDSVDGFIARRRHEATVTGARLDSLGDLTIVLTLLPGVWLLWPEILERELAFIIVGLLSYLVPTGIGLLKFRRVTSYHTWGAKAMAVLMGISLVLMFLGVSAVPFRVCIPLAVIEGAEEIAITVVLRRWRANVPSLAHAIRIRRQSTPVSGPGPDTP